MKRKKILLWSAVTIAVIITSVISFGYWFMSLIPAQDQFSELEKTQVNNLTYLVDNPLPKRGKILAVVTSTDAMGTSGKPTGYELTELSRAYYVFQANGFEVDIASPKGGEPPVIIDKEDMGQYDYAFLNDKKAQQKAKKTIPVAEVDPSQYEAVYFVGGKGAMFDFPDNPHIQMIVRSLYQSDKVVAAVCHGPAALINVQLDNGVSILDKKQICSFTNREELFLIPDAAEIFPFLLQDKLTEQGAEFHDGQVYLENVIQDKNIITGQNPWSTWKTAETIVAQLGYEPKRRPYTDEEAAIDVLTSYESHGYSGAREQLETFHAQQREVKRTLIAMHGIVAIMKWEIGKATQLIRLTSLAKSLSEG